MGHIRDCGVRAIATITGRTYDDVKQEFATRFGTYCVNGKQMREYITDDGWSWFNLQTVGVQGIPTTNDSLLIVTRRGFYSLINQQPNMIIDAPVCGYYRKVKS